MKISVILCTYNRSRILAKALASVALSQLPPRIDWEVLVVDNNSTDDTPQIVDEYSRRYPSRFRYIRESRPGKSFALNTGICACESEILAFMDDDVEVDPDWLHHLTKPLVNREWAGVGGRILPQAGFVPPDWMATTGRYALAPLAVFDRGTTGEELHESPFGTNMAFLREMFSKYGAFRTDLGPRPGADVQHNEDAEFGSRLLAHGERIWYEPSAVVYHSVPPERVQPAYFLAWWYSKVRADIRQNGIPAGTRWYIAGVPIYLFRRLCVWGIRWMCTINPARRFSSKINTFNAAGMIKECHRLHLETMRTDRQQATIRDSIPCDRKREAD